MPQVCEIWVVNLRSNIYKTSSLFLPSFQDFETQKMFTCVLCRESWHGIYVSFWIESQLDVVPDFKGWISLFERKLIFIRIGCVGNIKFWTIFSNFMIIKMHICHTP